MSRLDNRTIGLLESRHGEELSTLVRRLGGIPMSAPAVVEVPRLDDFRTFIDGLTQRRFSLAIFLTGVGVTTLLDEAGRRGCRDEAVKALKETTIAVRGAKPLVALKRFGLRASVSTARPHTSAELLKALSTIDVQGRGVLLVHYGERNVEIAGELRRRGARLEEVCPYEWTLPDDTTDIAAVVRAATSNRLDALLFTSQIQCRHLFEVAAEIGVAESLIASLNGDVVVGAIGPVCAARLRILGVTTDVIPEAANMPALLAAVADYFELTQPDDVGNLHT
ncbi:MAG: uroporphyrinogen-III synthase [Vicinamibacterales bacterium]